MCIGFFLFINGSQPGPPLPGPVGDPAAAKRLAAGKYQLAARYAGDVTFGPSASAAKKLTVTK